jgi:hypothetical protein
VPQQARYHIRYKPFQMTGEVRLKRTLV